MGVSQMKRYGGCAPSRRGMMLTLLVHLSLAHAWGPLMGFGSAVVALLFVLTAGQTALMLMRGPVTRLTVPHAWTIERSTAIRAPRRCRRAGAAAAGARG